MRKEYEEYKPTGIEWIPQIPAHWNWSFLSQVASEQKIKKPKEKMFPVMSLSYGQIIRKKNIDVGLVPASYDNYQLISDGNIILRFTDLQNDHTSLRTGLVKEAGIITSAYTNIQPKINSVFLSYLLHSYDTMKIFYGLGGGVRQSIGFKDVRYLQLPVPPRNEQDQIVRFLDWKVSSINKLTAIRKTQIAEFEALRKHIILSAVTHGLNKEVPFKKCEVEWISELPINWSILPLKRLFKMFSGATPQSANSEYWNGDIVWITPADFKTKDHYIYKGAKNLTDSGFNACSVTMIPPDSIVFSKRAPVGTVAINKVYLCTNQGCLSCVPFDGVSSEFFYYAMSVCTEEFERRAAGTTFREISLAAFGTFLMPVPPLNEQLKIVNYLDKLCMHIDLAVRNIQSQIETFNELKSRIVADTVTGQIDVRGIEIPEYDFVDEDVDADKESSEVESAENDDFIGVEE